MLVKSLELPDGPSMKSITASVIIFLFASIGGRWSLLTGCVFSFDGCFNLQLHIKKIVNLFERSAGKMMMILLH